MVCYLRDVRSALELRSLVRPETTSLHLLQSTSLAGICMRSHRGFATCATSAAPSVSSRQLGSHDQHLRPFVHSDVNRTAASTAQEYDIQVLMSEYRTQLGGRCQITKNSNCRVSNLTLITELVLFQQAAGDLRSVLPLLGIDSVAGHL